MADTSAQERAGSKLAEQATSKAELSYSYWTNAEKPANSDGTPKKLTNEEAAAYEQKQIEQGTAASAWNSAGTFEERTVTEWAKPCLKDCLLGVKHGNLAVTAVTDVTGDAHVWFIRGKKRHGFEFNITCSWQATTAAAAGANSGKAIAGTVKLPTASPDDLDDLHIEVELTDKAGESEAAQQQALQEAMQLKEPMTAALEKFYAELKQL